MTGIPLPFPNQTVAIPMWFGPDDSDVWRALLAGMRRTGACHVASPKDWPKAMELRDESAKKCQEPCGVVSEGRATCYMCFFFECPGGFLFGPIKKWARHDQASRICNHLICTMWVCLVPKWSQPKHAMLSTTWFVLKLGNRSPELFPQKPFVLALGP